MTRRTAALLTPLLLVLGWLAACAAPASRGDAPVHLVVLHTNDVHGQALPTSRGTGGLARLAARLEEVRAEIDEPHEGLLLVDAGDWFQGTPEGRIDGGLPFLETFVSLGFDAMAVGNHELDHGVAHLQGLLAATAPPAVCANLYEPATGERIDWVRPWIEVERAGLTLALVGLLTPSTPEITHPDARGLDFRDPVAELRAIEAELADRVDLVLPLTHLGHEDEVALAEALQPALIVGGHSHTFLNEGRRVGDTLVVQSGSSARTLGRVDLWIDPETGAVLSSTARLLQLDEEPDPAWARSDVAAACDALGAQASAELEVVVGTLGAPLGRTSGPRSSPAGNFITDAFRARTGADVALHNKGGTRRSLDAGPVTRRDLFEVLPFDNTLVVLELSGAELGACLRTAIEGDGHSGLEFSGLRVAIRPREGGGQFVAATVGDTEEPLDPERTYRVATNSFLARGGDGYIDPQWDPAPLDTGLLLRDVVEEVFLAEGTVVPDEGDRYRAVPDVEGDAAPAVAPSDPR